MTYPVEIDWIEDYLHGGDLPNLEIGGLEIGQCPICLKEMTLEISHIVIEPFVILAREIPSLVGSCTFEKQSRP